MTPDQRRARASRFREAMQDGFMAEAFDDIEQSIIDRWTVCQDAQQRDNLWHALNGLTSLRSHIAGIASGEPGDLSALQRRK